MAYSNVKFYIEYENLILKLFKKTISRVQATGF